MGSVPPDLSLELRPSFIPRAIGDFLRGLSSTRNPSERAEKLRDYIQKLEDEMRKIDAFKRELPLCLVLVNDAIAALKEELARVEDDGLPVLEEFIPLKKNRDQPPSFKKQRDSIDKMDWMKSIHLGRTDDYHSNRCDQNPSVEAKRQTTCKDYSPHDEDLAQGLSMLTPGMKSHAERFTSDALASRTSCSRSVSSPLPSPQFSLRLSHNAQQQSSRKQRRCWSPELHRRFVDALQKLGGSQVATPKQIRELMQVDGLTNDEVKSHLQKYRLHTRRPPPATPASSSVIVLRNLWVSEDQSNDSSKRSASSPQGPLQLAGNAGMGSVDDEEDERSESHSWKSHTNKLHNISA